MTHFGMLQCNKAKDGGCQMSAACSGTSLHLYFFTVLVLLLVVVLVSRCHVGPLNYFVSVLGCN